LHYGFMNDLEPEDRDSLLHDRQQKSVRDWLPTADERLKWHWPHQQTVKAALQRIANGDSKRLMIFMPPRHGKSELVTIRFSAWMLLRWPETKVVVACYNQDLANRFSRSIRRVY